MSESGSGDHRIVPHDPAWAGWFDEVAARIRAALGPVALEVEHFGSTSVPGLAARPILDVQVAVADVADQASYVPALATLGFERFHFPELPTDDYPLFVPADGTNEVHIAVCQLGGWQHRRHLAVRDYLRAHPDEAAAYEEAKRRAAELAHGDRSVYSASKNDFVVALEQRAVAWYTATNSR